MMRQFAKWTGRLAAVAAAASVATAASAQEEWSLGDNFLPATSREKVAGTFGGGSFEDGGNDLHDTAMKLVNPVSDLFDVSFRFDVDRGLGSTDATRMTLFIEPVIPFEINNDWNLVTRTTLPIIQQEELFNGAGDNHGIGDVQQAFFITPKTPDKKLIWGAGPMISWPTASDDALGSQKYEFGPTAVALQQRDKLTYGIEMNHLWSLPTLGDNDRRGVSQTLFKPFGAYTTDRQLTILVNTESIYDWQIDRWTIPVNVVVSQLLELKGHPINLFAGVRSYLDSPEGGPNWGVRFGVTFVLPRKS
jgi:hypothetical protein